VQGFETFHQSRETVNAPSCIEQTSTGIHSMARHFLLCPVAAFRSRRTRPDPVASSMPCQDNPRQAGTLSKRYSRSCARTATADALNEAVEFVPVRQPRNLPTCSITHKPILSSENVISGNLLNSIACRFAPYHRELYSRDVAFLNPRACAAGQGHEHQHATARRPTHFNQVTYDQVAMAAAAPRVHRTQRASQGCKTLEYDLHKPASGRRTFLLPAEDSVWLPQLSDPRT
jgi:hypothetical protein